MNEKDLFDINSITKDIHEREEVINKYRLTHHLDRETAIDMILKLRVTDQDVAKRTAEVLIAGAVPFKQASDECIISELQMQIGFLADKLRQIK